MSDVRSIYNKIEVYLRKHPKFVVVLVLITCALLIISRRPDSVTNAQFWAEDGKYWYADAYNANPIDTLFRTYAGYFVVIYRLVAIVSLLLPFRYVPLFFNMVALCFQLLPILLICSSRFKKIIPGRLLAIVLCIIYAAIPNSTEVFLNLSNIQWHLGLTSMLIFIAAPSKKIFWNIFDFSVLIITGMAGPLVILLLPIVLLQWYRSKDKILKLRLITLSLLSLAQIVSIFFISHYPRVGGTQNDASLWKFIKMITGQIYTGGILGEKYVDLFYGSKSSLLIVFSIGTGIIIYTLIKGPYWMKLLISFGAISIAAMLASLRPTKNFDTWAGLTNPGGGQRYWYIPIVIWITVLIWMAMSAKNSLIKGVGIGFVGLLIIAGIPSGWKMRNYYSDLNFKYYAQQLENSPSGTKVSIPINPAWQMDLIKK